MNCLNLKDFILNFIKNKNFYFLLYGNNLFLIYKIKNIIKNLFMNLNIYFILYDDNFRANIKNLHLNDISSDKKLYIIEIINFKINYLLFLKKIFNIKNKKFLLIIFNINKNLYKYKKFTIFIKKFINYKINNFKKFNIINIIKYKIKIYNNKLYNLLKILFKNIKNNNILLINEINKLNFIININKKLNNKLILKKIDYNYKDFLKIIIKLKFIDLLNVISYFKKQNTSIFIISNLIKILLYKMLNYKELFNKKKVKFLFYKKIFFIKSKNFKKFANLKKYKIFYFLNYIYIFDWNINKKNIYINKIYSEKKWLIFKNLCLKLMFYLLNVRNNNQT